MWLFKFLESQNAPHYHEHSLLPMLSAERLLSQGKYKKIFSDIKALVHLPEVYYQKLYVALITRFVEYVQVLPLFEGAPLGSMCTIGLERSLIALQSLQKGGGQADDLFAFALFSAALLADVGMLTTHRYVMICDKHGAFLRMWLPHQGSLLESGDYFKIRYHQAPPKNLPGLLAPLHAQIIMPAVGYIWLTEHPELFSWWLAVLSGSEEGSGGFGARLNRIQEELKKLLDKKLASFGLNVDTLEPKATEAGEIFWRWLKKQLLLQHILVNTPESGVYIIDEGIFLETPRIFDIFCRTHPQYQAVTVQHQFSLLGLISGYDERLHHYIAKPTAPIAKYLNLKAQQAMQPQSAPTNNPQSFFTQTMSAHQAYNAYQEYVAGPPLKGIIVRNPALLYKQDNLPPKAVNMVLQNTKPAVQAYFEHIEQAEPRIHFATFFPPDSNN